MMSILNSLLAGVFVIVLFSSFNHKADIHSKRTETYGCLKGDCYNGYGVFVFHTGSRYLGDFKEGKPHGNGIMYYSNSSKYIGSWVDSEKDGRGRYVFSEGHEYLGAFRKDLFHGFGVMNYANGDRYEGEWQNNYPDGPGKYFFIGGERYDGLFARGKFNGKGTFYYADGSRFQGLWKDSRKHGSGSLHTADGGLREEKWVDGVQATNGTANAIPERGGSSGSKPSGNHSRSYDNSPNGISGSVKIYALVVGVSAYNAMQTLKYTDDDAYQFYAFLKSPEGGAIPDDQIQLLIDETATRKNIFYALNHVLSKADADDVVMFYFSGHGLDGAFVPVDFDGLNNIIYHDEIRRILANNRARHKLVFGDACHSGSLYGMVGENEVLASRSTDGMLRQYYKAFENSTGGTALLLSSKQKEVSLEDSGLRSGVFSHFLIKGLKGQVDTNKDNLVTIMELSEYVQSKVKAYTAGAQTPVLLGQFDKNMPVGVVRH